MKSLNNIYNVTPVILCGGSGKRLWPLSRTSFPKQFLALFGKITLFQQAIERLQNLKNDRIQLNSPIIVANEEHRFLILDQLREIKKGKTQLLLEPIGRNTAPALTFASLEATQNDSDPILVVMPADQSVKDQKAFVKVLREAIDIAASGSIVVLGVSPTTPDTRFGYIQKDTLLDKNNYYKVLHFAEKPNITTAKNYIDSGEYFWNSGIFVLRASVWLSAIRQFNYDIYDITLQAFNKRTRDNNFLRPDELLFSMIPSNSIDFAVMEKCPNSIFDINMLILEAGWNDLGSWDAVWQEGVKDKNGNVSYGDTLIQNTYNSLIYSSNRFIVTSDIKDLLIIETADSVMIIDRNNVQQMKSVVSCLESKKRNEQNIHCKVVRPWGWFQNLDESDQFKVKRIYVRPGERLSLQKHQHRAEHWVVVKGIAEIKCGNKVIHLKENQSTYIPKGELHQLANIGIEPLEIIEVQSGNYLCEDYIERIDDKDGREVILKKDKL